MLPAGENHLGHPLVERRRADGHRRGPAGDSLRGDLDLVPPVGAQELGKHAIGGRPSRLVDELERELGALAHAEACEGLPAPRVLGDLESDQLVRIPGASTRCTACRVAYDDHGTFRMKGATPAHRAEQRGSELAVAPRSDDDQTCVDRLLDEHLDRMPVHRSLLDVVGIAQLRNNLG